MPAPLLHQFIIFIIPIPIVGKDIKYLQIGKRITLFFTSYGIKFI
jgi:hypothetical protein